MARKSRCFALNDDEYLFLKAISIRLKNHDVKTISQAIDKEIDKHIREANSMKKLKRSISK